MASGRGIWIAASAFILWGMLPVYWKALAGVGAGEILGHRMVWSAVCCVLLVLRKGSLGRILNALSEPRVLLLALVCALLVGGNWLTYIWAVNASLVLETSLGYFINPLVCVLLGCVFLGERMRPVQLAAVAIAAAGVLYLALSYGRFPWVALVLAFSFGFYGLFRKTAKLESLDGLTAETLLLLLPALIYLAGLEIDGSGSFLNGDWSTKLLLIGAGPATATPLLLFAAGARMLPLTTVGLLQYIAPSLQFLLAVFVYNEPFTQAHLVTFSAIWLAILLYSTESWLFSPRRALLSASQ
ncbi:MAG: EamA family transporter RarD [Bdellovibrionales bacterium]|nr:EamA family transporter RarD [Bdellovibrionales bacterium]